MSSNVGKLSPLQEILKRGDNLDPSDQFFLVQAQHLTVLAIDHLQHPMILSYVVFA